MPLLIVLGIIVALSALLIIEAGQKQTKSKRIAKLAKKAKEADDAIDDK